MKNETGISLKANIIVWSIIMTGLFAMVIFASLYKA
jgi:hypothetical protein